MPELIDRYAALEKMCNDCKSGYDGHCPHPFGMCHEYENILQVPTIEPEVRHGRWIEESPNEYYCSYCGKYAPIAKNMRHCDCSKWCKECGTKMDGGTDNG